MKNKKLKSSVEAFNIQLPPGSKVVYYPAIDKQGIIIHKNGKRTKTATKAVMKGGTGIISLEGVGNVDIRHIVNGSVAMLDINTFSKNFKHKW